MIDNKYNKYSSKCSSKYSKLYVAVVASLSIPAFAADVVDLGTTTVVGSRLPASVSDIPTAVQFIEKQDIQKQALAGRKMADVLATAVPSLAASSGTTSNFGQTMRGRSVQFMLDGVPLTSSRNISRQLNSISPQEVERVEVLSGATSVYGAGATGGIINIITKSAEQDGLRMQSKVGFSTADDFSNQTHGYELAQSFAYKDAGLSARLGIDYTARGRILDASGELVGPEPAQTDRQDTQSLNVTTNIKQQIGSTQSISLSANYYKDEQDTDYGPDYGNNLEVLLNPKVEPSLKAVKGLNQDKQPETERKQVALKYNHKDVMGQSLNLEAYYRQENSRFFGFPSPFSVKSALPILKATGLPDDQVAANYKKLQSAAFAVIQSEVDIEVAGVRSALQSKVNVANTPLTLTYGVDFERETDKQNANQYDLQTFMKSNGLTYEQVGSISMGPETQTDNLGIFASAEAAVNDDLTLTAGIRHQKIDSETSRFNATNDVLLAQLLGRFKLPYNYKPVGSGEVSHNQTLFNFGAVYDVNAKHQVFANFSQGFTLPDLLRFLRDVNSDFVVNSDNVEPITVNSFEAGWRGYLATETEASVTGFYNTSDKVVTFNKDRTVTVADTDERVYGAEASIDAGITDNWQVGASASYTRGQFKDAAGQWRELNPFRISPAKGTLYAQYASPEGHGVRMQVSGVQGTDKAYKDSLKASFDDNVRPFGAPKIKGYATVDVITQFKPPVGLLEFGVYNLADKDYKTVYSQGAGQLYGKYTSVPAAGRSFGLSYTVDY